jgi:lysophospholipase L1-like esterase
VQGRDLVGVHIVLQRDLGNRLAAGQGFVWQGFQLIQRKHMKADFKKWLLQVAAIALFVGSQSAIAAEKRIMVFGDSNAWGLSNTETVLPVVRYPSNVRWTGVMAKQLGDGYVVEDEALSGRTAASDDASFGIAGAGMNGLQYLPAALATHAPLDLVVVVLGTNDVKPSFGKTPLDISIDVMRLVSEVQKSTGVATGYRPPKVLVVSPPPLGKIANVDWWLKTFPPESVTKSRELGTAMGRMAAAAGVPFFDASRVLPTMDGGDGVHMTPAAHKALGQALAAEVKRALN